MNYTEAFLMGMQKLKEAEIGEAQLDARLLLEEVCGTDHNTLLCHGDREVSEAEEEQYRKALEQRAVHVPLQHLLGYQDFMGLKRVHKDAALWSIYTPIDCGAGTGEQNYLATKYVDRHIPRVPYIYDGQEYQTVSTSDWSPYEWSINNVAMAEVMHTVLAYYQAGRAEEAYRLLKANVLDFMYLGSSPGNFGQLSTMDRATGEGYRDFSDVTGISSRAFIEGLYGITPNALEGKCIIRPGFPAAWDSASVHTPYLDYSFRRVGDKDIFDIEQNFARPLQIVIRQNMGGGKYKDTELTADKRQHVELATITPGSVVLKQILVLVRAMEGTLLPVSLMREPPKKLPTPTPKVVMARPVTFWLARRVTVRKQYSRPISREPKRELRMGMSTARKGFSAPDADCS